ncbi:unnamed protein product [Lymnaea stagnalis]|uniref:Uncharacterized protein n=1 Tax=Lymnaea stagnalis TaxID=6523 RepID=A0AAV2IBL4_LYMST
MEYSAGCCVLLVIVLAYSADGQTNVPNDPLWSTFVQVLSAQTQRSVQDINTLGLSDPTISFLWNGYKANMPSYAAPTPPPTTTPPPLPDLYQTSYSFSSNAINQASPSPSPSSASNADMYNTLLNIINQPSSATAAQPVAPPASTSTSSQDVLKAYAQMAAGSTTGATGATDPYALLQQYTASTNSAGGTLDASKLLQQYSSLMAGTSGTSGATPTTAGGSQDFNALLQQYASIMGGTSGGATAPTASSSPNYAQLLQQYNQIMSAAPTPASTPAPTAASRSGGALTQEQLLQIYAQLSAAANAPTAAPPTATQTTTNTVSPPAPTNTFDQQLAMFFPQFKNLFPTQSAGSPNSTTSSNTTDATQMIFDTLLFGPTMTATTEAPPTAAKPAVPPTSPLNPLQNMINPPSGSGGAAMLHDHVENVFKTKASREMGCRFLPELLELDLLPTAPIDCLGKCPFPYVNSQRFGVYCLCCPPGVNDQTAGLMSVMRRASYMETPLAVVT